MGDLKSKLPDLQEVTGMLGKLYKDMKKSVIEIAGAYKEKHKDTEEKAPETKKAETSETTPKAEKPKAETPKTEEPPKSE